VKQAVDIKNRLPHRFTPRNNINVLKRYNGKPGLSTAKECHKKNDYEN